MTFHKTTNNFYKTKILDSDMREKVKNINKCIRKMCQGKPRRAWTGISNNYKFTRLYGKIELAKK